ncbi:MAG: hypothetical protein ACP5H5_00370 [Pyrobaculum sp.]
MRKVAFVILAALVAGALIYFYQAATSYTKPEGEARSATPTSPTPTAQAGAPPTATSTSPASATSTATPTANTPSTTSPPAAAGTKTTTATTAPGFRRDSYHVNYTYTITVYIGDMSLRLVGWSVEGVGPLGNYSFGKFVFNIPPRGPVEVSHKAATEGRLMYVVTCAGGECQAETAAANYTLFHFLHGVNTTRAVKGTCTHLGYTGSAVEEKGWISPEAFAYILGGLPANGSGVYVAEMCEVGGVPLAVAGDVYLNMTLYGQALTMKLKIESSAVAVAPYNSTLYQRILAEAKAAAQKARA